MLSKLVKKFLPEWNTKIHSELDGLMFCEEKGIITCETNLINDVGEYRFYRDHHFIFTRNDIEQNQRAWVLWHEIGHFILHPVEAARFTDNVLARKVETEAHIVAAVALMPYSLIKEKTLQEIKEEFNYPTRLILLRKWIYDTRKF